MYLNRRLLVIMALISLLIVVGIKWWWSAVTVTTPSTPYLAVGMVGDSKGLKDLCPDGSVERVRYLPGSAVYESPVSYDPTRGIRPLLLDDWRLGTDARSLDLIFKKHVRFHNGKQLTALEVKACWEKTLSRAASGEVVSLFAPIAGVDSFLKGQTKEIYGLQVMSPQVLRVKFLRPQAYFISSLTHPAFWVYDSLDKTATAPGTGAFRIKSLEDNSIQVEAFAQYHEGVAQISGIEFQIFTDEAKALAAYREGKLNLLDEVQPAEAKDLIQDERLAKQFIRQPLLAVYGVAFNLDKEPWRDNYLLRRALNYAIDRPAIVREIFAGGALACSGPLPMGLTLGKTAARGYSYNPDLAKQLLNDSGYPDGDGLPSITLYYLPDSGYKQLAVSVAEQLSTLGIEVYPRPINQKSLLSELNARRFQTCLVGWHADYPEAYAFFGTIYNNGITGYQNARVSKLLGDAGGLYKSTSKRQQTLLQAYKIITEDAPMIWLCQPQTVKLVSPLVSGIEINGMNQINWGQVGFRSQP